MKAVLISIQPKWCELIASGIKTVEVRKTKPKIETPFKVYIYMTAGDASYPVKIDGFPMTCHNNGGRTVIGEFVCDEIIVAECGSYCKIPPQAAQLDAFDLIEYADDKPVYGWHISNLIIYDKPKELSEFKKINRECWYSDLGLAKRDCPECKNKGCFVTRPPQSWCYVEELR